LAYSPSPTTIWLATFVANPIAWLLAVSNSYVLNSMITFAAETTPTERKSLHYVIFTCRRLVANTMTVFVLSYFMPA
jgi:putative flippase GtrA